MLVLAIASSAAVAHYCSVSDDGGSSSPALVPTIAVGVVGGGTAVVAGANYLGEIINHWPGVEFCFAISLSDVVSGGGGCGGGGGGDSNECGALTRPPTPCRVRDDGTGQGIGRAPSEPGTYRAKSYYPASGAAGAATTIVVHAEGDAGVNPVDHHEDAVTDATFECPVNLVSADGGCEFEVCDWTDYPDDVMGWSVPEVGRITDGVPMRLSRPSGPFRLRPGTAKQIGTDQQIARQKADNANARLQYKAAQEGIERGKYQFHEIKPVKMGGDPEAHGNKIRLLTADHTRVGRFWSKVKTAANRLARPGECQPPTGSGGDGGIGPTG